MKTLLEKEGPNQENCRARFFGAMIIAIGKDGIIALFNQAPENLLGYKADQDRPIKNLYL